jgi:hypothetical protein
VRWSGIVAFEQWAKLGKAATYDGDVELECCPCRGPLESPGHVLDAGGQAGEVSLHVKEARDGGCRATSKVCVSLGATKAKRQASVSSEYLQKANGEYAGQANLLPLL